jgi:hypothetical protein
MATDHCHVTIRASTHHGFAVAIAPKVIEAVRHESCAVMHLIKRDVETMTKKDTALQTVTEVTIPLSFTDTVKATREALNLVKDIASMVGGGVRSLPET